jgi:hypothetical protein
MLGLKLVDIAINSMGVSMTVEKVEEILHAQGLDKEYKVFSHMSYGELVYEINKL